MERLFEYRGHSLYCHHSVDTEPEPSNFYMHTHEWHEMYMLLTGKASFLVEGTEYQLRPYDIMIMRKAEAHMIVVSPGEPYERIAIHFSPDLILPLDPTGILIQSYNARPLGKGNLYHSNKFRNFVDFLRNDADEQEKRVLLSSILFSALTEIYMQFSAGIANGGPNSRVKNTQSLKETAGAGTGDIDAPAQNMGLTSALIDFVNEHLFSDLSLNTLCKHYYLSTSQLNRIFRRATGSSVWQYICAKRLLAVREQIMAGENIAAAAQACGFKDYSSFYRLYVSRFGHSPVEDKGIRS